MTGRIRILPDALANRIAAGEVVERPASVIKELIENSLDAGAQSITVEVRGAGRQLIKVEDDGGGMSPDDLLLSLERYATSKVRSLRDLYAVRTLGFRGEALPSIASVSRMSITSSLGNAAPARLVRMEGGVIKKVEDVVRPRGTSVEVRSLFYNTPARLKFMKSQATERGWIANALQQQALSRPCVSFNLRMGMRETISAPPAASIRDRVASLYGHNLAQELVDVELACGELKVAGLISLPTMSRSSRDMQFTFVNGRCIRSGLAMNAIAQGYRTLLPRGRHPVVFLYLELDPSIVDANVHPAKLEVKFKDYSQIHEAIVEAVVRGLFIGQPASGRAEVTAVARSAAVQRSIPAREPVPDSEGDASMPQSFSAPARAPALERQMRLPVSGGLSALGQVHNMFIVAGSGEGVIIIDQHTAHERILYEKILRQFRESNVESQHLLIPQPVNLSPVEMGVMEERREELERLGFSVEAFGEGTALLRSAPALLSVSDSARIFQEVAAHLLEAGRLRPFQELAEELAAIMACKGAIKAGDPLDDMRMAGLLRDLESLEKPASCPHGRPIYLLLGIEEIKKKFSRK